MKMIIYISLGFFGILVVLLASGCSIYYPTSYRAFIPKQWDSEYKEYERLCEENIGKVVYARPVLDIKYVDYQTFMWFLPDKQIVPQVLVFTDSISKKVFYIKIIGFHHDTSWSSFYPEWFIMPHTEKNYIYKGYDIENIASHISSIKQEISNNSFIIGKDFDDIQGFSSYDWYMLKILFGGINDAS
ncbi:hypothetical protein CQA53_11160 [Helicobacter didelphidarum]|uniref:Lipoprotein n=1 Tax=Helicobacter didelphidarum TaxID=2040648 RepID=A0A3D8I497_9HELI|nr:hypothetical protein [Helicobacter didelphidarum]RDU59968.1 hypothetical protein CQA53_11160 [Helicobacter didelphidarum]